MLDEPLGSLDAFTRMNMQDEILNFNRQEIKNLNDNGNSRRRRSCLYVI
ncbi:hypothetical protein ANHYDRO_00354 [Anaerococcus hydrogenalis DSM 7454]|uniref:Uncharacterized protein n=1 Tax=Anaerococcus hydrogenalis DSM 7454 TaxID=561177 RepID=B6W708_9FIRM|nr:hypothetical protein ANHYDRO_00354 [Anaerococcus hydrogenalis DSM 7454]